MLSLAHIGLAGAFGALLVGWLVVVVRRLYLARHLYILWLIRDTVKNVLADFFLNGIGGSPPPLTESHCAQKSLAEWGGTPPLTEKIR